MATASAPRTAPLAEGLFYPVSPANNRRNEGFADYHKAIRQWLNKRLRHEDATTRALSPTMHRSYSRELHRLWQLATPIIAERFFTLFINTAEQGAKESHSAIISCLSAGGEVHGEFWALLEIRMRQHLLVPQYLDDKGTGLDHAHIHHDTFSLGGKLIAEAEGTILDFSIETCRDVAEKNPHIGPQQLYRGLPETLPEKQWFRREVLDSHIETQKAGERYSKAKRLEAVYNSRLKALKGRNLSDGEKALRSFFLANTKKPA